MPSGLLPVRSARNARSPATWLHDALGLSFQKTSAVLSNLGVGQSYPSPPVHSHRVRRQRAPSRACPWP